MADKPTYEELISKIRDLEEKVQHYEEIEKTTKEKKGLNDRSAFQLSMFLENTEDYIMIADENGISQYFNSAYAKIMKELVNLEMEPGIQPHKLLDDSKEIEYWDGLHQRVLSGEKFKAEYSHQLDNGDVLYFEFSFCPIYQEGKIKGFTEIARDITKHKQTEDALRENEVKYRTLFESNNFLTYLTDSKGNILLANNCGANFFELTPETIIGKSFFELRPDRAEMYQGVIDTILSTGKTQEFETLYPTPKKDKWLSVTVTPLKIQKDERLQIVTQDITKRKRSEEILKESEERYHDIFDNLMDVYFKTNLDGTIENVSPSAKIILGYSEAELIGKKTDMLYQSPKDREGLLYTLKEKGQVRGFELLFKKKTGEPCHISVNADLNYNKNGEPLGLTGTLRDITEHKKAENERIRAQEIASENEKLALVGRIAGKMAHDFNNVLGIIMGNTELSLLDCQDSLIKKTLELIYEQTIRGKNLTKNLVAFAKDQELKQEFFRINEKIDLVINLMRKDLEGIELIKKESPGIPELLADPGMIEHALVNLIQNSIHAMSKVEYPKITIITYSSDNHICFEIEDNGCGIAKDNLENIYEPSFTLKGGNDVTGSYKTSIKGSGYGMANVKKYIEQHKGTISIESEFGSGTKIKISLPVVKKELTYEEKIEIRTGKAHFGKFILLVEDETALSDVQYRILTEEPCNHKVDIANNGKVAMDLFERNKYDLISLDYILPEDINGMDIYYHIRQSDKTIPIMFVSGNIEFLESIKDLMKKDPYVDHLSKPCKNINYLNCINNLFSRSI